MAGLIRFFTALPHPTPNPTSESYSVGHIVNAGFANFFFFYRLIKKEKVGLCIGSSQGVTGPSGVLLGCVPLTGALAVPDTGKESRSALVPIHTVQYCLCSVCFLFY